LTAKNFPNQISHPKQTNSKIGDNYATYFRKGTWLSCCRFLILVVLGEKFGLDFFAVKIATLDDHRIDYSCPCHAQNSTWCIQQSTNTIVRAAVSNLLRLSINMEGGEGGVK